MGHWAWPVFQLVHAVLRAAFDTADEYLPRHAAGITYDIVASDSMLSERMAPHSDIRQPGGLSAALHLLSLSP